MQESNLLDKDGKPIIFPRLKLWSQIPQEEIVKQIAYSSSFTEGDINGLIVALSSEIARWMGQGHSVKIDGLGVFSPSLGLRKGKERESGEEGEVRRNAQSICVSNIRFRADKRLIRDTGRHCTVERSNEKQRRSSTRYTPEERLALARNYLQQNPMLTVSQYCLLTGLLRNTAAKELKQWAAQEDSGIRVQGRGTHKVYVGAK